jgi:hypothetical protein
VRIGEAPSDAVPGRLLPLYEFRLIPRDDRDLGPYLVADPSVKRLSVAFSQVGEPADPPPDR